jgi:DNA-binding PucR family transcriptional regulator
LLIVSGHEGGTDVDFLAVLAGTLHVHLAHGRVIDRTAEALGIHRSTVRYRLYRIRELTGVRPEAPGALSSLERLRRSAERDSDERRRDGR